ncbi:MAG: imidazolonepropionase [Phycisphaerales bacterium]|nr:imidazolonepropionase [Phycisphaerales bacterium]
MLIRDIGRLVIVPPGPLVGAQMREIQTLPNAALLVKDGKIAWFGEQKNAPNAPDDEILSAEGGCVIPGLIDCHTHIPFAGERSDEFVRRVAGESYLSIMQAGGGIRVTTRAVREASEDELVNINLPRLARILRDGVTTVECKSGYGLTVDDELKQLRAIRRLAAMQPIELVPTYLGAHAVPAEFEGDADGFIERIASADVMQRVADERLARFCDVFCDRGALNVDQARRVLERGKAAGLRPKLHADELAQIGASRLAGEVGAVSADHLEQIDDAGIAAMKAAGVVAVALPGTSFFLGIEHCDARRMIEAGLAVAVATDYNPGSCHIESLPFVMSIACCQLRMTPVETLAAVTANAAAAIGEQARIGAIAIGHDADLVVLDTPTLEAWFYSPGRNRVRVVVKAGKVVGDQRV